MDNNHHIPQKLSLKKLLNIFLITFKIGSVTFGGGMAMLTIISAEFSEKRDWVSGDDISDIAAVAQTLPGIIAVNVSILTGYRIGGVPAALVAGLGSVLPSFIVLCIIATFYSVLSDNVYVRGILRGVSGAVVALFVSTLYKMSRKNVKDLWGLGFFIIAIALMLIFPSLSVIYIILGGALLGFVLYYLILRRSGGAGND
ncbi:MAG TPA: chromate transporter [Clostridiales bacterium]|jgi:chromate transporter|nr:chromate transporter [Clostridiales bacterium]